MSKLVSPNEMFEAAKKVMLAGKEPVSVTDWTSIFHFFAANVHPEVHLPCLNLLKMIYDAPLSDEDLVAISNTQLARRR